MNGIWPLALYSIGAVATALIIGRRMAAWVMGEFPDLDQCQGGFHPDGDDIALLAFISVVWPIGLPLGLMMIRPPRPSRAPGALAKIIFGRKTASDGDRS